MMEEMDQAYGERQEAMASFMEAFDKMVEAFVEVMRELWHWLKRTMLQIWRFMVGYTWSARYPKLSRIIRWVAWRLPEWVVWRVRLPRAFCG